MRQFYLCSVCGNLVGKIEDGGNTPFCCGKPMSRLEPASTDGAVEKHVPVIDCTDLPGLGTRVLISVGSVRHPSESYHYIKWIALETDRGTHMCRLNAGDMPSAVFYLPGGEKIVSAYAYCNLHGLWAC